MKQNFSNRIVNIRNSRFGCLLTLVVVGLLLGSVGLKWVVNGVLIFFVLITVIPIVGFWILRWWLRKNLVQDSCPVCNYALTGLNNTELRCSNCGELLEVEAGQFLRQTPPGTIDVEVIDISDND